MCDTVTNDPAKVDIDLVHEDPSSRIKHSEKVQDASTGTVARLIGLAR